MIIWASYLSSYSQTSDTLQSGDTLKYVLPKHRLRFVSLGFAGGRFASTPEM